MVKIPFCIAIKNRWKSSMDHKMSLETADLCQLLQFAYNAFSPTMLANQFILSGSRFVITVNRVKKKE